MAHHSWPGPLWSRLRFSFSKVLVSFWYSENYLYNYILDSLFGSQHFLGMARLQIARLLRPKFKTRPRQRPDFEFWISLAIIICLLPKFKIATDFGILDFASYHYLSTTKIQNSAAPAAELLIVSSASYPKLSNTKIRNSADRGPNFEFGVALAINNYSYQNCIHCFMYLQSNI